MMNDNNQLPGASSAAPLPSDPPDRGDSLPVQAEKLSGQALRARYGWRLGLLIGGLALVIGVISLARHFFLTQEETTIFGSILLISIGLACLLALAGLSRAGRPTLGGILTIVILLVHVLIFPVLTYIPAVVTGLILLLVISGITAYVLPAAYSLPVIFLSAVVAGSSWLLELYISDTTPARLTSYNVTVSIVLLLVLGLMVAFRFATLAFRSKVIVATLVIALVPLAMLAWMNAQQTSNLVQTNTENNLGYLVSHAANAYNTYIQSQLDLIRIQAQLIDLGELATMPADERTGSDTQIDAIIAMQAFSRQDITHVDSYALLDADGKNILDTQQASVGNDESTYEYFRQPLRNGLPYISQVIFDGRTAYLYFSSPVRDNQGDIVGVLRVRYLATVLQEIMTDLQVDAANGISAVVLDEEYYLRLAHSEDPTLAYKTYALLTPQEISVLQISGRLPEGPSDEMSTGQPEVVENLNAKQPGEFFTFESLAAEEAVEAVYKRLDYIPWVIMIRQRQSVVQVPLQQQTRSAVTLLLVGALFVAGTALLVGQVLTAPITRLTTVARQVATGHLDARARVESTDEVGELASTFNTMTSELQTTLSSLEQRVADRTRSVELSADVSRRLSNILDPAQLVSEVVELVQFAFEYYHVHVYLLDDSESDGSLSYLHMVGGTGEAGQLLLERGHTIQLGRGLVGRCAELGSVLLSPDTQTDPNWLPNPLLPDTRSEIAVPIIYADHVVGVLDVQHNRVAGLGQQDADTLLGIANQLAIALRNARQYSESLQRSERESMVVRSVQQIQSAQTVPDALQIAARELAHLVQSAQTGRASAAQAGQVRTTVRLGGVVEHSADDGRKESTL